MNDSYWEKIGLLITFWNVLLHVHVLHHRVLSRFFPRGRRVKLFMETQKKSSHLD